jgi:hypothetical protein
MGSAEMAERPRRIASWIMECERSWRSVFHRGLSNWARISGRA